MIKTRVVSDIETCRDLWNSFVKPGNISDLWDFRLCFHRHFENEPCFLVLEDQEGLLAVLPLSFLNHEDTYVFFPGEVWNSKTWLERTQIYCREPEAMGHILSACPERTHLRYMEGQAAALSQDLEEDELAYLFFPPDVGFDLNIYFKRFSWKKIKAIKKEISSILVPGSSWHLNRLSDYDLLVEMNLNRFGMNSYFHDARFAESFGDAVRWLHRRGWLRMVSLDIKGRTAAVDLAAAFEGTYVVFLGGTHAEFPGVAKAMNMYHLEQACNQRFSRVDFLCGDFYWKKLWHLDPEPLYKFVSPSLKAPEHARQEMLEECDVALSMTGMDAARA